MSFALDAKVCGRCLPRSDSSNKPLEWTGHQRIHACALNSLPDTQGQRSPWRTTAPCTSSQIGQQLNLCRERVWQARSR
jgi:hypothetical protein